MNTARVSRFCALLVLLLPGAGFSQATICQILSNGPTALRINIVYLSEGYTAAQLGQFTNDAKAVLNHQLSIAPFNAYATYFNAFAISVPSNESGSDHPASGIYHDTYFNSTFYSYQIERLLTIPPNDIDGNYADGQGKVYALLSSLMPDYDLPVVLVNDTEYGGAGGSVLVSSLNSSSPEIAAHELGHTFASLGDEYSDPYPGWVPYEMANVTHTNVAPIKWQAWIPAGTPVPTPDISTYYSVVGLFEGAEYQTTGWYRPKHICKMRSLGYNYCEVCSEALVKALYSRIRPIETNAPATTTVISLSNAQPVSLSVSVLKPPTNRLAAQWFVNNAAVAGATNTSFSLGAADLPFGSNQVRVDVTDSTSVVRTDPTSLLKDTRTWQVQSLTTRLAARRAGNKVVLSWPTNAQGFALEYKSDLTQSSWQAGDSPSVVSNTYSVTNTASGTFKAYRLRK